MENLTVLIVDDHPVFRKGLRALLAAMPNTVLVGEATSGADAVRLAEQVQPDVILMDLQMPGGGGLAAIRQIVQTSSHIRILVVTMFQDDEFGVCRDARWCAGLCPERYERRGHRAGHQCRWER